MLRRTAAAPGAGAIDLRDHPLFAELFTGDPPPSPPGAIALEVRSSDGRLYRLDAALQRTP